jgi:hypothetical protein
MPDHASDFIYRAAFSGIRVQTGLQQFDRNRCLQNDSIQSTPDFIEGNTAVCVFCSAQFKNKHMKCEILMTFKKRISHYLNMSLD